MEEKLGEQLISPDADSNTLGKVLLNVLAELPEDRSTPLDVFIAEKLLQKGALTKEQLFESIRECKSASSGTTLFNVLNSRGHISEKELDILIEGYRNQPGSPDKPYFAEDATFGEIAIKKNHTTKSQLWSAILEQERKRTSGEEKRLGEIMVNRGTLTISQAKDILVEQGKHILHCPDCGEQYNVKNFSPDREYSCLSCGSKLSDTGEISSLDVSGTAFEKTITQ